jgi:hypothetical protein
MHPVTYNTSVIIARRVTSVPENCVWAVLLAELTASAGDDVRRKIHEETSRAYEKKGGLIAPAAEDWLLASRILFWLTRRRRQRASGKTPPLKTGASQQMLLDALIAVSARRADATVITKDYDVTKPSGTTASSSSNARATIFRLLDGQRGKRTRV